MRARVWGCRGSVAVPGTGTVKYGGNTSCVEVRLASGHALVLDAGTGMRPLGVSMQEDPAVELHILLTHLHLDHLQGLGFFRPLFSPGLEIHVWGPSSPVQNLAERIAMLCRDHAKYRRIVEAGKAHIAANYSSERIDALIQEACGAE